jgi:CRISPR-associated Cas5-like protein
MSKTGAREKVFRLKLWFPLAAFWIVVMGIGFAVSFYVLPYGLLWLVAVADQIKTANYGP